MTDADVIRYGTDPNGRPILLTRRAASWVTAYVAACKARGFTPQIVQGSHMARLGGGAKASAGYHDHGGAIDFRTWDRTDAERAFMVREARRRGGAAWIRDKAHGGMDPHMHVTLGWDAGEIDPGTRAQWQSYLQGRDGLSSNGPDYHWRPDPLVKSWSPPSYDRTRGPAVDAAISALNKAKGDPARMRIIRAALERLKSLPTWRKRT